MSIQRVPIRSVDTALQLTKLAESINGLIDGKLDVIGSLTLTENVASTTVTDNKFESQMVPLLIPTTANAAAEIGAGTMYLSDRSQGSFELTHANNAQVDRTYLYVRLG